MKENTKQVSIEMEAAAFSLELLKRKSVFVSYEKHYDLDILVKKIKWGLTGVEPKNWLDDVVTANFDYSDRFDDGIAAYKEFISTREALLTSEMSDVEKRLLLLIDTAASLYEETSDCRYYVRFAQALQNYKTWLNRKIYRVELFIVHLKKLLTGSGIMMDFRAKFRTVVHFLFKNLDDYHGASNNHRYPLKSFSYCQTPNQNEFQTYKISYKDRQGGTLLAGLPA